MYMSLTIIRGMTQELLLFNYFFPQVKLKEALTKLMKTLAINLKAYKGHHDKLY